MNINSQTNTNINFKALHVANCGELKLYKLETPADLEFIKQIPSKINAAELMPQIQKKKCSRWNDMIKLAVDVAREKQCTTYIETFKDKICGILTYSRDKSAISLECVCTWPVKIGEKVKFAGKTLFYRLFKDFEKNNDSKIALDAILDGPFNNVARYKTLGFEEVAENPEFAEVNMVATKSSVKKTLKELDNIIEYGEGSGISVNLSDSVKI